MKVLILLCSLALARAGIISTNYAPAPAVSTIYSAHAPNAHALVSPVTTLTAPGYGSVLTTHESRTSNIDGSHQTTLSKTLNTPYSTLQKFDSRITDHGFVSHSGPVYSNSYSQPLASYNAVNPVVHTIPSSISYTSHPIATKTITPVASLSGAVVSKLSPGLTTYASHTPIAQPAVKITYSEAPLVSHMTFTGLGTRYSW